MIADTIKYLVDEINRVYGNALGQDFVVLGNIARLDVSSSAGSADLSSGVVLTLVNLEEEKTLKNSPYYVKPADSSEGMQRRNPPIHLNLYLLFSCAEDDYFQAVSKIDRIAVFFQVKNVFTSEMASVPFPDRMDKLIVDLFSPNFEQINHLWGILGGKQLPSVIYKARLVEIQESVLRPVDIVREVNTTEKVL